LDLWCQCGGERGKESEDELIEDLRCHYVDQSVVNKYLEGLVCD